MKVCDINHVGILRNIVIGINVELFFNTGKNASFIISPPVSDSLRSGLKFYP